MKLPSSYLRNLLWMNSSQVVMRILRIACVMVVARILGPDTYGVAALCLASHELLQVFTRGGLTAKLIQANPAQINSIAQTTYQLTWILCIGIGLVQIGFAFGLSFVYQNGDLFAPILVLAGIPLLLPFGTVQAGFLCRQQRMDVIAQTDLYQSIFDTLCTIVLVICGFGIWSLIAPKLAAVPIWLWQMRRHHPWRPGSQWQWQGWRQIVSFGGHILWIEVLTTLRQNLDLILIGYFLGLEAVGLYYFAFNAGLGLSLGLLKASAVTAFSHLCGQHTQNLLDRVQGSVSLIAALLAPIIIAQAVLAPIYVPVIFGQRWVDLGAVPLISILCLSALPRILMDIYGQGLRASGLPKMDALAQTFYTTVYLFAVILAAQFSLYWIAITLLITQMTAGLIYGWWSRKLIQQITNPRQPIQQFL